MKKQEKIDIKRVLEPQLQFMSASYAEEVKEKFPFILDDEDDIDDDPDPSEIKADSKTVTQENTRGILQNMSRVRFGNKFITDDIKQEALNGAAVSYEGGRGFYFKSKKGMMYPMFLVTGDRGLNMVFAHTEEERIALKSIGYFDVIDGWKACIEKGIYPYKENFYTQDATDSLGRTSHSAGFINEGAAAALEEEYAEDEGGEDIEEDDDY